MSIKNTSSIDNYNNNNSNSSKEYISSESEKALVKVFKKRVFGGLNLVDPIEKCDFAKPPLGSFRIWTRKLVNKKSPVEVNIGLRASSLLHFGTPYTHCVFGEPPGRGVLTVSQNKKIGSIEISFSDEEYTKRLTDGLKTIGCAVECKSIDTPPGIIGPEYYRAALVFEDPREFLFFSRYLCKQGYSAINKFVENMKKELEYPPVILNAIQSCNEDYNLDNPQYKDLVDKVKEIQGSELLIPPKIWGKKVSASVGAMTSLLAPGFNSLKYAREGHYCAHVILDKTEGLLLYFPDLQDEKGKFHRFGSHHAKKTNEGLNNQKFDFIYKDLKKDPLIIANKQYSGCLQSNDPLEIVRYLMQVCKQTRFEVLRFLRENKIRKTPLGKEIIEQLKRRIDGEEGYDLRLVMVKDKKFNVEQLKVNPKKFKFQAIPDLPEAAKDIDIEIGLLEAFGENIDGIIKNNLNDNGKHSREILVEGIKNIIKVAKGGNHSGVPKDPVERKEFALRLEFYLKHVLYLLQFVEEEFKQMHIAHLAIGGTACAGRHIQAAFDVINALRTKAPSAVYHDAETLGAHLSLVDQDLVKFIDKHLSGIRKSCVDTLAEIYLSKYHGDLSHLKNSILKKIGEERGIPGYEIGNYQDPYQGCAQDIDKETMLRDFDEIYNPREVVQQIYLCLCYGEAGAGGDVMDKVIDFFKHHAPLEFQKNEDEQGKFVYEFFEDDYEHVKKDYLIQLQIITQHIIDQGIEKL